MSARISLVCVALLVACSTGVDAPNDTPTPGTDAGRVTLTPDAGLQDDVPDASSAAPDAGSVDEEPDAGPVDEEPDAGPLPDPDGGEPPEGWDGGGEPTTEPVKSMELFGAQQRAASAATALVARPSGPRSSANPPRWTLVWSDEFNGPEDGDDPSCFSREPQCMHNVGWGHRACPTATHAQLGQLNKCTWSIYSSYNWMDQGVEGKHKLNAFDPSQVSVRNGVLTLTSSQRSVATKDCGRKYADATLGGFDNYTTQCPIISGAVMSQRFDTWDPSAPPLVAGFTQQYGRFEVRAKLPKGPGSWPAHWMLPQDPSPAWPYSGEIDIMELWYDKPRSVYGTLHGGDAARSLGVNNDHEWRAEGPAYTQANRNETWFNDFHTYAVEWDPWEIRFYVDRWHVGTTRDGMLVRHRKSGNDVALDVPDRQFYMLLNSTIAPFRGSWWWQRPDPDDFDTQTHLIDSVRVYRTCESDTDRCPYGGTWDGANCLVRAVPASAHAWIEGSTFAYAQQAGPRNCPLGGRGRADGTCAMTFPERAAPAFFAGNLYVAGGCSENTLSPTCRNPCAGVGLFENEGCFLNETADGFKGEVRDGKFYYWTSNIFDRTRAEDCQPGHGFDNGRGCYFDVPAGRTGLVSNEGSTARFFVTPVCEAHDAVPNCAQPCPHGGRSDGQGCFLRTAPQGTQAFVYGTGMYYAKLSTTAGAECPAGGSFDGANCHLGAGPGGLTPYLRGERFYVPAACGRVPF